MSAVKTRRAAILAAIVEERIETQEQMVAALANRGIVASQASVSRDIAVLRLAKVEGRWTASPAEPPPADPLEQRIAGRLLSVASAGDHLVVLSTPAGEAGGVALALDGLELDGVVGSVAGDDTIFVAVESAAAGGAVIDRLSSLLAG